MISQQLQQQKAGVDSFNPDLLTKQRNNWLRKGYSDYVLTPTMVCFSEVPQNFFGKSFFEVKFIFKKFVLKTEKVQH